MIVCFLFSDGYYSMLPRLSWYQVNYQANINKNGLRKYLAYSVTLEKEVEVSEQGTRKRRSVDPQSVQFEIGSQSECPEPRNKDVPCNGPVKKGKKFRLVQYNLNSKFLCFLRGVVSII